MGRFERQLAAAQAVYDAQCDCCDHGPRERAPVVERETGTELALEFGGVGEPGDWRHAIAEAQRLNRILGADWQEGLPV